MLSPLTRAGRGKGPGLMLSPLTRAGRGKGPGLMLSPLTRAGRGKGPGLMLSPLTRAGRGKGPGLMLSPLTRARRTLGFSDLWKLPSYPCSGKRSSGVWSTSLAASLSLYSIAITIVPAAPTKVTQKYLTQNWIWLGGGGWGGGLWKEFDFLLSFSLRSSRSKCNACNASVIFYSSTWKTSHPLVAWTG